MEANKYECGSCFQRFQHESQLKRHHQGKMCKNKVCSNCQTRFRETRDLMRHEKNRKIITCTHCNRLFCNNEHFQKHLRSINKTVIENFDLDTPISTKSGYEEYDGFKELVREKIGEIADQDKEYNYYKIINREIDSDFTYKDLEKLLVDIYSHQRNAFKINLGFGFILFNTVEEQFKYYYNSSNNMLFEHAITIADREDLTKFLKKITNLDISTNYYLKKPSSGWVLAGLKNVEIFIFDMKDVPIGNPPVDLPDYIRKSKSINALTHDANRHHEFKDNRCFFRCLALHQGLNIRGLEKATKRIQDSFERHTGRSFEKGINISHIPTLEVYFNVSVNVYSLQEDGSADIIYLSRLSYQPMHINLYKNHFSYITNFTTFAKRFECQMCEQIFDCVRSLKRHVDTCCTGKEEVYIGGKHKKDETLFERLEKEGIKIEEEDRYYTFISVYDYEALQVPRDERILGRNICFKHIPATFSVCSNIPGHTEPVHKWSKGDPQQLVDEMVIIQVKHQERASELMRKKFSYVFNKLTEELKDREERQEAMDDDQQTINEKRKKKLKTLIASLASYCDQLIILGFNSQKYDIPLIKRYLPSSLQRLDSIPSRIIRKNNSYMALSTKRLKYLDVCNYLAAGTSLEGFYKAFNVQTPKGCFPYQWFDSLDKRKVTYLPSINEFFSILTNSTISKEKHDQCIEEWINQGMETFGDYVQYYNNHDVIGMVEAIDKMLDIYKKKGLDLFKESVSLAGITQKYLFKNLKDDYFTGIGKEHSHIYKDLKEQGIVGGPSLVFNRYQEAGETKIKGKELCRKVIGFDANSLYLWCTAQKMPTGFYCLREKKNNFKKQIRYSKESIQWLNCLIREKGINIRHAENSVHGEARIENYSVDGFCVETKQIFSYYGCYHHGHHCNDKFNPEKWRQTMEREDGLRKIGYDVVSITSCEWHKNPASKIWYQTADDATICTYKDIENGIMEDEIFGFVKYNIHVPDHLKPKFSEFPPIFKNTKITLDDIGDHMKEFCRKTNRTTGVERSLISSMFGKGIVTLTPLFKKYVEMGLVVTDIEWIQEYNPKSVFKWFQDEVVHDRRMADLDPNYKIKGESSKTMGNAGYGGTLMDKSKHTSIKFCEEKKISNHIKNPLFKSMEELNDNIYEVEKSKKKVYLDTPIQIGIAVYSYAKLSLLSFWEFINKFLVNDLYQLMECDTDSLYIAFARDTIDECVKPELKEDWDKEKCNWFSSRDKTEMEFEGRVIPFTQWDKRTPNKYKAEFEGDGMICLNSKVYHIWGHDKDGNEISKTSCKGSQQKRNVLVKKHFLSILETQKPHHVKNAGFIRDGLNTKSYTQTKIGLGYFYAKRKVLSDGISTTHLDI